MDKRNLGSQGLPHKADKEVRGPAGGRLPPDLTAFPGRDVPIPGTKRCEYLEENAGAADVELTRDDLARLEEVAPVGAAAGERYDEAGMQTVNW